MPLLARRARRRLTFRALLEEIEDAIEAADHGVQVAIDRAVEAGLPVEQIEGIGIKALDALTPLPEPLENLSDAVLARLDRYLERKIEISQADSEARRARLARVDRMRERLRSRAA